MNAHLNERQRRQYVQDGYFVLKGLLDRNTAGRVREEIVRLRSEIARAGELREDLIEGRVRGQAAEVAPEQRYRKLAAIATRSQLLWDEFYHAARLRGVLRALLGDEVLLKFSSVFLKPARGGGATPWHQDIGLWRDHDHSAVSCWLAVDAATAENGCLQVVPGSHQEPIIEHVKYDGEIHAELPRELFEGRAVEPIELDSGDALIWHSHLWHYSPENASARDRIAIAGVWSNLGEAISSERVRAYRVYLEGGKPVAFPPPEFRVRPVHEPAAATLESATY